MHITTGHQVYDQMQIKTMMHHWNLRVLCRKEWKINCRLTWDNQRCRSDWLHLCSSPPLGRTPAEGVWPPAAPMPGTEWTAAHQPEKLRIPQCPCSRSPSAPAPSHRKKANKMLQKGRPMPGADNGRWRSVAGWLWLGGGTEPRWRWGGWGVWKPGKYKVPHTACHMVPVRPSTGAVGATRRPEEWWEPRAPTKRPTPGSGNAGTLVAKHHQGLSWSLLGPHLRRCPRRSRWPPWWSRPSYHPDEDRAEDSWWHS